MPVRVISSAWKRAIHSLPPRGDVVQLVQLGVVAAADDAALARAERRLVHQGGLERLAQVGAQLQPRFQVAQQRATGGPSPWP